jgi:hypothetical protein
MVIQLTLNNLLYLLICLNLLLGCNSERKEMTYFQTGELKTEWIYSTTGNKSVYLEYYKNGNVREKIEYKNGKKDGKSIAFNSDGSTAQIFYYKNGKREGKAEIFYPDGKILEHQYFSNGILLDFKKYNRDGEQHGETMAMFHFENDTVKLNDEVVIRAKLGNLYDSTFLKGQFLVTSNLNALEEPVDTIEVVSSNSNDYVYKFKASKKGLNYFSGCLQHLVKADTIDAHYFYQICFKEPYYVYE